MKNGILYFLKFDIITYAARALLVIMIYALIKLPKGSNAFFLAIAVTVIAAFFSLFHVRSNKYVRGIIKTAEEQFTKDFLRRSALSENCDIYVTRSFAADKNSFLSHRLDGEIIYPHLVFLTYHETIDRLFVHIRVKSLLKENAEKDFFYEAPKDAKLDIQVEKLDARIEQVMVKFPTINGESIPEFPVRLDFHLRNMLSTCSQNKFDL